MHRLSRKTLATAVCLSALAGFVDAVGFMQMGGFFVSFMSGNSTRLAVAASMQDIPRLLLLGQIIGCFVAGVMCGTLLNLRLPVTRAPVCILGFVTLLLSAAWLTDFLGLEERAALLMAAAMGATNTILNTNGQVIAVTYMTGALVNIGKKMAEALHGGSALAWLPYFALWGGLIGGGLIGAILFSTFGPPSILIAAFYSAILTTAIAYTVIYR